MISGNRAQKQENQSQTSLVTRAVEALFSEESLKVKPADPVAEVLGYDIVETLFTEELEVKPAEVLAEVTGLVEVPDPCTARPSWWPQGDKPSYDSSISDTSGQSDDDLENIVMNLRQQSKDYEPVSKSEESDYDESEDADQGL